jgi:hypothetical protein
MNIKFDPDPPSNTRKTHESGIVGTYCHPYPGVWTTDRHTDKMAALTTSRLPYVPGSTHDCSVQVKEPHRTSSSDVTSLRVMMAMLDPCLRSWKIYRTDLAAGCTLSTLFTR